MPFQRFTSVLIAAFILALALPLSIGSMAALADNGGESGGVELITEIEKNTPPVVKNVTARQEPGTTMVEITYDVSDKHQAEVTISLRYWDGSSWQGCISFVPQESIPIGTGREASWNAGIDFPGHYLTNCRIQVIANDGYTKGDPPFNNISTIIWPDPAYRSEPQSPPFTLDTEAPAGYGCSSPADGATSVSRNPTLIAAAGTDHSPPIYYFFVLALDPDFTEGVQQSEWQEDTTWSPPTALNYGGNYWWMMKAKDSCGNEGDYSTLFSFTTEIPPGEELEEMPPEVAAELLEGIPPEDAADVLGAMGAEATSAIMGAMETDALAEVIPHASEEWLTETLPRLSPEKLYDIPPQVLFESLPNAPTEQLVGEVPPVPPPDLPAAIVVYTTEAEEQFLCVQTRAGEWVIIAGTPIPITKIMIKAGADLTDVVTTIKQLPGKPAEITAELPEEQLAYAYLQITLENATPRDIIAGHITFKVDQEWLQQYNIHKWSVALNRYDPQLEQWVSLPTKRLQEDDTFIYYSAVTTGFSDFAVSGSTSLPPLQFEVTDLVISPEVALLGDEVSISADITNISDKPVVYTAVLWLNGTVEAVESLLVAPGETTTASFEVVKYSYGSHQVRIDRLVGSFEVTEMEEEAVAVAWGLILGIVGGVVVVGLVVYFIIRRRRGFHVNSLGIHNR